eukprot:25170-Chlamydomonas_euryale.AAC.1
MTDVAVASPDYPPTFPSCKIIHCHRTPPLRHTPHLCAALHPRLQTTFGKGCPLTAFKHAFKTRAFKKHAFKHVASKPMFADRPLAQLCGRRWAVQAEAPGGRCVRPGQIRGEQCQNEGG